jgi:2-polyprenyl-3-methyl-5-hydroxy-6-metoxy-1,4-benzoquinol methylase
MFVSKIKRKWFFDMPIELVNREEFLLDYCRGKDVIHLGCCGSPYCQERYLEGNLFHVKLIGTAKKVIGVDIDEQSINFLKNAGINNLKVADVENLNIESEPSDFQIILAGEILEHLDNPGSFLRGINRLSNKNTEFIITTINTPTLKSFIRALGNKEMVHHDHVCYYSIKTLTQLLNRFSLSIINYFYYCAPRVSESGIMVGILNRISKVMCNFVPNLGDGLIAICKFKK